MMVVRQDMFILLVQNGSLGIWAIDNQILVDVAIAHFGQNRKFSGILDVFRSISTYLYQKLDKLL